MTHTTLKQLLYRLTCISQHPQLRTARIPLQVCCVHTLADGMHQTKYQYKRQTLVAVVTSCRQEVGKKERETREGMQTASNYNSAAAIDLNMLTQDTDRQWYDLVTLCSQLETSLPLTWYAGQLLYHLASGCFCLQIRSTRGRQTNRQMINPQFAT